MFRSVWDALSGNKSAESSSNVENDEDKPLVLSAQSAPPTPPVPREFILQPAPPTSSLHDKIASKTCKDPEIITYMHSTRTDYYPLLYECVLHNNTDMLKLLLAKYKTILLNGIIGTQEERVEYMKTRHHQLLKLAIKHNILESLIVILKYLASDTVICECHAYAKYIGWRAHVCQDSFGSCYNSCSKLSLEDTNFDELQAYAVYLDDKKYMYARLWDLANNKQIHKLCLCKNAVHKWTCMYNPFTCVNCYKNAILHIADKTEYLNGISFAQLNDVCTCVVKNDPALFTPPRPLKIQINKLSN
jgi:hypothetical protein